MNNSKMYTIVKELKGLNLAELEALNIHLFHLRERIKEIEKEKIKNITIELIREENE